MRKIMTAWLSPGMILAKDVYHDDQLILPQGYKLTEKAIARLAHYSISFVFIEEKIQ